MIPVVRLVVLFTTGTPASGAQELLWNNPFGGAGGDPFDRAVQAYSDGLIGEAVRIWHKLAEEGNVKAQYNLGLLYEEGKGVPQRPDLAAFWYRTAARQGYTDALFNLGGLYYRGSGVPRITEEAVKLWTIAAEHGMGDAQYNLAVVLLEGDGIPRDPDKAREWLRIAAVNGHPDAAALLEALIAQQAKAASRHDRSRDAGPPVEPIPLLDPDDSTRPRPATRNR